MAASAHDACHRSLHHAYRERGLTPVLFYRDARGLIWPTVINPETAPRIMAVYPRALAAAREDDRATRDAFVHLAFWYVGARFPGSVRTSAEASGAEAPAQVVRARPGARAGAEAAAGTRAGRVIIARGRTVSDVEMQMMYELAAEGRTVEALAESTVDGQRTADFLVDGVKTELKTVSKITSKDPSQALKRIIEKAARQAPHIIVDVRRQAGMTAELAREAAGRALGAVKAGRIRQIRLIGDGFDITVLPKVR